MEIALLATLVALAWKLVDTVKALRAGDVNIVVTQLAVWGAGVLVVWLGSETRWGDSIDINGVALTHLNTAEIVLLGMCLLSAGSVLYDFKKAVDNTDSAAFPPLLPPRQPSE